MNNNPINFTDAFGNSIDIGKKADANVGKKEVTEVRIGDIDAVGNITNAGVHKNAKTDEVLSAEQLNEIDEAKKHNAKLESEALATNTVIKMKKLLIDNAKFETLYEPTSGLLYEAHLVNGFTLKDLTPDERLLYDNINSPEVTYTLNVHSDKPDAFIMEKGKVGSISNTVLNYPVEPAIRKLIASDMTDNFTLVAYIFCIKEDFTQMSKKELKKHDLHLFIERNEAKFYFKNHVKAKNYTNRPVPLVDKNNKQVVPKDYKL